MQMALKRVTLTGNDCDVARHAAMLGHAMFTILSTVSPACRSTAKDGAATWYDILQCSEDLRELPLGSEEFLERLRKGCADAEKGVHLDDDDEARCNAVALKLYLLGWETNGGATLPLEAKPLIDELGAVLRQVDAEFVCLLVARFWVGVAYRFCDARHLNNMHVSTASWGLSSRIKAELEALSLVASCDLEAVHLLAAPTHLRSLREREPQLFAAELGRVLTALGCAASEDGGSSDDALFLAAQIVTSAQELVVSAASCADDLKHVLDKATTVLLEAESCRRPSEQSVLRAVARGCLEVGYRPAATRQLTEHADLMPTRVSAVLDQLNQELTTDGCFRVPPLLVAAVACATESGRAVLPPGGQPVVSFHGGVLAVPRPSAGSATALWRDVCKVHAAERPECRAARHSAPARGCVWRVEVGAVAPDGACHVRGVVVVSILILPPPPPHTHTHTHTQTRARERE
jgi:hypothetical protein